MPEQEKPIEMGEWVRRRAEKVRAQKIDFRLLGGLQPLDKYTIVVEPTIAEKYAEKLLQAKREEPASIEAELNEELARKQESKDTEAMSATDETESKKE